MADETKIRKRRKLQEWEKERLEFCQKLAQVSSMIRRFAGNIEHLLVAAEELNRIAKEIEPHE